MMKKWLLSVMVVLLGVAFTVPDADAKRMGGGGTTGMKRQAPQRTTPAAPDGKPAQQAPANNAQQQPAQPNAAAAPNAANAGAAAAPKRSWLGPIAGLAAGLGLAALFSHFGLGGALANVLTMVLLAVVAVFVVRWLLRRFGPNAARSGPRYQFAGATPNADAREPAPGEAAMQRSMLPGATTAAAAPATSGSAPQVAGDFDRAAFERIAKLIFIRMQAANDGADIQDLRRFTTPEMFAAVQLDLQDRKSAPQRTDVVQLDAEVIDVGQEDGQQIVSVRFHGLIREDKDAPAVPFDEVWHFVRPIDGSRDWAIAGIAQTA
jgi:predicted lipid-binding transport protein (Tim44 family)